ncbi:DUF1376 domain-containing protein [Brevundimonas sp. LjRoot202]|uniref:DUF1376 domain-containing protein n=1 Tax=Brevundimonas sp. LjRoot202 TaxID=3342281 RepID=UPI003ECC80B8
MAAPPYQKLFWGSYHKHTAHLGHAREHGAYLLLIGALWNNEGKLPAEDDVLAGYAKLTVKEWLAVKPKLMPLFRVARGKLTQPRVTEDLTKYRDTSGKRREAGKSGGNASAGKRALNRQANASGLPTKSEPEPKKERTPSPQGGEVDLKRFAKALLIAADAGCAFPVLVDRLHKAQPVVDGKRRSTGPDVQRALGGALKRGGMPSEIEAAVRAFYALPASTKDGGQFANGAAVILNRDRWKEFTPAAGQAPAGQEPVATFNAPQVRASLVKATDEDFVVRYVDHYCRWVPDGRRLEAKTPGIAAALSGKLNGWAERNNVTITVAAANDQKPDLFAKGAA